MEEQGGFLQKVCDTDTGVKNKCPYSDNEFYTIQYRHGRVDISNICSNDTRFYQACNSKIGGKITNNDILCEYYLCKRRFGVFTSYELERMGRALCNGRSDCENTELDESDCLKEKTKVLPSGEVIPLRHFCNDICDTVYCEDEAVCGGYVYGMYCMYGGEKHYIPPTWICNGKSQCDNKEDETFCSGYSESEQTCFHSSSNSNSVPIFNFTRCSVPHKTSTNPNYCANNWDQTNCTDPSRVGLTCKIHGYQSTLSKYMICLGEEEETCDDNIENTCYTISKKCRNIHKHMMCDNKFDCEDRSGV